MSVSPTALPARSAIVSFDPLLADHTTEDTRTRVFALSQAVWSLALAVGSLCAGAPELIARLTTLSATDAYRPPYLVMAALTLIAGLAAYVCGGLVLGIGFRRLLARRSVASGAMIAVR